MSGLEIVSGNWITSPAPRIASGRMSEKTPSQIELDQLIAHNEAWRAARNASGKLTDVEITVMCREFNHNPCEETARPLLADKRLPLSIRKSAFKHTPEGQMVAVDAERSSALVALNRFSLHRKHLTAEQLLKLSACMDMLADLGSSDAFKGARECADAQNLAAESHASQMARDENQRPRQGD